MKIIAVKWIDAVSRDAWSDKAEPVEPPEIITIGMLLEKTKNHLTVCLNLDKPNEQTSCVISIPAKMIKKIIELGEFKNDLENITIHQKPVQTYPKRRATKKPDNGQANPSTQMGRDNPPTDGQMG